MGKLYINATKNFGKKIDNAISSTGGRIDGIQYSLSDISQSKIQMLQIENTKLFAEFPLYYLTTNNDYIGHYFNRTPVPLGEDKFFTPNENNNKLICMSNHLNFDFFNSLPLTPMEYSKKRNELLEMIKSYYSIYYANDYLMTPTFIIDKVNSWEEIMLLDILKETQIFLEENEKSEVFLSLLLDPKLLETTNVASNVLSYIENFDVINSVSLTLISNESMYYHDSEDYENVLVFIKELKAKGIKIHLQYAGVKDVLFSVLGIDRFSVGWFGSYRNFDTNSKKLSELGSVSFGKRIKKILTEEVMSEVPLSYLSILTDEQCREIFGISKNRVDFIDYTDLEQIYWKEMLKIIEKDDIVEKTYTGDELIFNRCDLLNNKFSRAIDNLNFLVNKLEEAGRNSDAKKIKKNNIVYVKLYKEIIENFQSRLFF